MSTDVARPTRSARPTGWVPFALVTLVAIAALRHAWGEWIDDDDADHATDHRYGLRARMEGSFAELGRVGEVRERHAAGLGRLAEDHVPRRPVQRPPVAHPPLQRPEDAVVGEGVGIG